jgi:methionyl-tRNA formyltransferase
MQQKIHIRKNILKMKKINFAFFSTIDNPLLPLIIDKTLEYKLKNVYIICDQAKTSSKMKDVFKERVGNFFEKFDIYKTKRKLSFFFVDSHNSNQTIDLLDELKINCVFNAGILKKLSNKIINKIEFGCINVHPAILPLYRGASSTEWSIYNSDRVGNTVHFMNKNYDEGPIIKIEYYKFSKKTKYYDIRRTVYEKGINLGLQTLSYMQKNKLDHRKFKIQSKNEGKIYKPIPNKKLKFIINKVNKYGYI